MNELTTDIHLSVTTAHPNKQKPLPLPLPSKSSCSPLLSLRVYCNHLSKHKSWEDGFQFVLDMLRRIDRMSVFHGCLRSTHPEVLLPWGGKRQKSGAFAVDPQRKGCHHGFTTATTYLTCRGRRGDALLLFSCRFLVRRRHIR